MADSIVVRNLVKTFKRRGQSEVHAVDAAFSGALWALKRQ